MSFVEDVKPILVSHAKDMVKEVLAVAVFPALAKAVKESASPIDDVVLAALEIPLKKALADAIDGL